MATTNLLSVEMWHAANHKVCTETYWIW